MSQQNRPRRASDPSDLPHVPCDLCERYIAYCRCDNCQAICCLKCIRTEFMDYGSRHDYERTYRCQACEEERSVPSYECDFGSCSIV